MSFSFTLYFVEREIKPEVSCSVRLVLYNFNTRKLGEMNFSVVVCVLQGHTIVFTKVERQNLNSK